MTRDEAVQKLSTVGHLSMAHAEDLYDSFFEKPVLPQYVADWLKENDWREETLGKQTIFDVFNNLTLNASNGYYKDVKEWVKSNGNILAQAWVNGYEVEKEKRYRVSMLNTRNYENHAQLLCEADGKMFWCGECHTLRTKFTYKELEDAGFGWLLDCEGVEVKEVVDE